MFIFHLQRQKHVTDIATRTEGLDKEGLMSLRQADMLPLI